MRPTFIALLLAMPTFAVEPKIARDIAYAEPKNERQTLDVYAPPDAKGKPVIFWIHGGGWQRGDKSEVDHKPQAFVDQGYVFVATNYRFVPNVTIKEMAGDIARAILWVHGHIREHGGDPQTIIVAGHSAGAQLAALVSSDERYLKAQGLPLSTIKACVPVDGDTYDVPLQIETVEQRRKDIYAWKFGDLEQQRDLSPVTHATKGKQIPPVLVLHVADHPETKAQSLRLAKVLSDAGYSAKTFGEEGTDHVALNANLGKPDDKPTKALFEFLATALRKHEGRHSNCIANLPLMSRTQASLPEPSQTGFFVLLLVICFLILLNSIFTTAIFQAVSAGGPNWLKEPRLSQPLLFLAPLVLLSLELWAGSLLGRLWRRAKGHR